MSLIHFGLMYDTDTKEFFEVGLQEMPVDSKEYVFESDEWRRPTQDEIDHSIVASQVLGRILEFTNDMRLGSL
jgi:hypothetical protein